MDVRVPMSESQELSQAAAIKCVCVCVCVCVCETPPMSIK